MSTSICPLVCISVITSFSLSSFVVSSIETGGQRYLPSCGKSCVSASLGSGAAFSAVPEPEAFIPAPASAADGSFALLTALSLFSFSPPVPSIAKTSSSFLSFSLFLACFFCAGELTGCPGRLPDADMSIFVSFLLFSIILRSRAASMFDFTASAGFVTVLKSCIRLVPVSIIIETKSARIITILAPSIPSAAVMGMPKRPLKKPPP